MDVWLGNPVTTRSMEICPVCGNDVDHSTRSCMFCGSEFEDTPFERVFKPGPADGGCLFHILNQLLARTQEIHPIAQAYIQFDSAHAKGIDLTVHVGEKLAGFLFITIRTDAFNADRFAVEVDDDFFVPGAAAQADADGLFHGIRECECGRLGDDERLKTEDE